MTNVLAFKKSSCDLGTQLRELADYADAHPEEFGKAVLMHAPGVLTFRWTWFGKITLAELIGMLEIAKIECYNTHVEEA
jgi:hypothetical protein